MKEQFPIGIISDIGDVGKKKELFNFLQYSKLTEKAQQTVQIGDLGISKSFLQQNNITIPHNHFMFGGNHDYYSDMPPNLGDYGLYPFNEHSLAFFIRGERSNDIFRRQEGVTWWKNEELTTSELDACFDQYQKEKPEIVLSHACPHFLLEKGHVHKKKRHRHLEPSNTSLRLTEFWESHKPRLWIFGHHHQNVDIQIGRTEFLCSKQGEMLGFDEKMEKFQRLTLFS